MLVSTSLTALSDERGVPAPAISLWNLQDCASAFIDIQVTFESSTKEYLHWSLHGNRKHFGQTYSHTATDTHSRGIVAVHSWEVNMMERRREESRMTARGWSTVRLRWEWSQRMRFLSRSPDDRAAIRTFTAYRKVVALCVKIVSIKNGHHRHTDFCCIDTITQRLYHNLYPLCLKAACFGLWNLICCLEYIFTTATDHSD